MNVLYVPEKKEYSILLLCSGVFYKCQLGQVGWLCSVFCILIDFCLPVLSTTERGILNSPTIIFLLSLLSFLLFHVSWSSDIRFRYIQYCYVFLKNWLFNIMKCLFISGNVTCSEVYFDTNVTTLDFFWLKSSKYDFFHFFFLLALLKYIRQLIAFIYIVQFNEFFFFSQL